MMNSVSATSARFPSFQQWGPIGVLAGGIFVIDLLIPLGVAVGTLYIIIVLVSLLYQNSELTICTAIGCSTLIILAFFLSPVESEFWKVALNRGLSLFAIWTTTLVARSQIQQTQKIVTKEQTLQHFLKSLPTACFSFDRSGTILSWNPAAERIYGYSQQEAIGALSYDLIGTPWTHEETAKVITGVFEGKTFENLIWDDRNKQSERGWRMGNIFPVLNSQGQVTHGINILSDITAQKIAETELQYKKVLLEAVLDSATDAIYAKNQEGKYILFNKAASKMVGQTAEAIIGLNDTQVFRPDIAKMLDKFDKMVFSSNQSLSYEGILSDPTGTCVFSNTKSPLRNMQGSTLGLVGIARDITQEKKVQKDLLLVERVFQASPDHISILGKDYRYRRVNEAYERAHGKISQQLIGMSVADLLGENIFTQTVKPKLERCFQGEEFHYEAWFPFADGQKRFMGVSYLPLLQSNRDIQEIVVIARDLTERKESEEALRNSEERFRTYFETGLVGMAITSINKSWIEVNDRLCSLLGYSREALQQKTWVELTHPDDLLEDETEFNKLLSGSHDGYSLNKRFIRKDGSLIFTNLYMNAIREPSGKVAYITTMLEDITERKEVEQHLEESQAWIAGIVDIAEDAIIAIDKSQHIQLFNKGAEKIFGYSMEEIIGQRLDKLIPKRFSEWHQEHIAKFASTPEVARRMAERMPVYGRRKDDIEFPAEASISKLETESGTTFTVILHDTTEQKLAEEALKQSERLANSTMNALAAHLCVIDESGQILATNERWNQFARENHGDPEKLGKGINYLTVCAQSAEEREKDAQTFIDGLTAVLKKQEKEFFFDYTCSSPEKIRWFSCRIRRFPDPGPVRAVVSHYDITDRKVLEETIRQQNEELEVKVQQRTSRIQELEQRRMQVEKLAALSQIAAGVAHEINNPLASISQSLVLLKRALSEDHPHYRYMGKAEDCIQRIATITNNLYQLYRPSGPTLMPVDLRICLQTATEIMQERAFKHGMRIQAPSLSHPIITKVSEGELIQVICNLLHNAIDASPEKSTIEMNLTTGPKTLTLFVTDQGGGIPPEDAPHIFEPFYTTKQNRSEGGMGLGLSISHSLVESMGGSLDFSTSLEQGSTFMITLPLT